MPSGRARTLVVVATLAAVLTVAGVLVAVLGFGNGNDTPAPTTITTPPDTTAASPTVPPASLAAPFRASAARPWRTGFANGVMPYSLSDAQLAADLDGMAATGAHWFRMDFYWPTIQQAGPQSWDWSATDRLVTAAESRGLEILAMPAYSPQWARPAGTIDHHPPLDPDWYARFVYQAAKRYAPLGVHTWEIWNEPNVAAFWAPKPDPAAYTALLRRAYTAIKSVDPTATIVSAGLATARDASDGSSYSPRTFLQHAYDAGLHGAFDAVGLHPSSFPALPLDPKEWNAFYNAPTVYQVMVDHGDGGKKIWATEEGAPTGTTFDSVTPQFQRDTLVAAYHAWAAWPFTGPMLWYSWRDSGVDPQDREQNFGLVTNNSTPKPALEAFDEIVKELRAASTRH
jgi:hypothetical protein